MSRFTARRVVPVVLAVALAGAGAYFAFRPAGRTAAAAPQPPVALLLVNSGPPNLLPGGPVPTAAEIETHRRTQTALVRSEFVTNAALRDPKVRELEAVRGRADAPAWLAEHLTADYGENSSVLRIGVAGVPPKEAALLANAVATAFLNEVAQKDVDTQRHRLRTLEDTRSELTRALDVRKKELNHLAATAGVPPNAADHRALLASLYQERTGLRLELARARPEKDARPEGGAREKLLREELSGLDERIRACEQADLAPTRAEVARLEAAVTAVAAEATRVQVDLNAPARVTFLAPAAVPEAEAAGTASAPPRH